MVSLVQYCTRLCTSAANFEMNAMRAIPGSSSTDGISARLLSQYAMISSISRIISWTLLFPQCNYRSGCNGRTIDVRIACRFCMDSVARTRKTCPQTLEIEVMMTTCLCHLPELCQLLCQSQQVCGTSWQWKMAGIIMIGRYHRHVRVFSESLSLMMVVRSNAERCHSLAFKQKNGSHPISSASPVLDLCCRAS